MKKFASLFAIAAMAAATPAYAAVDLTGDNFSVVVNTDLLGQIANLGTVTAPGAAGSLGVFTIDIGSDFFRISNRGNDTSVQLGDPVTQVYDIDFTDLTKGFGASGFTVANAGGVQFQSPLTLSSISKDDVFHANINGTFFPANSSLTFTLTSPVASGVPEPATWALMLVGFGAVGFAMRRRRELAYSHA